MYKKAWHLGKESFESPFTEEGEKQTMFSAYTDALVNLGRMYLKQNRFVEFHNVLEELLAAAPDREEAVLLKKQMERLEEGKSSEGSSP